MALGYLISPALQVEDKDGKPLVGGEIVVFRHGTTTPYITWKNFNGDRNPARVALNALGMAVLLADDSQLYDVYCYDRNGVQQWSRLNVSATTGGEGGGGETGSDLSVLRCDAADLTQSGQFVFDTLSRQGEGAYVDSEGHIRLAKGTWHYDITVEVDYSPLEETGDTTNLVLYTTLNRACLDFDLSYAHTGTLQLSGIVNADDGTILSVGVGGMATGMTVSVADCGIFEVTGTSTSWEYYEAGAGIEIDGNIIAVDPDEVQGKLTAGTGIDITDDVISVTGTFSQEQADWAQTDSSAVDYIKNKPDMSVYATDAELTAGLATKQDVISDLSTIRSGAAAGTTAVQPGSLATVATTGSYDDLSDKPSIPAALSAGDGISIASDVVSAKVDGTTISVNLDGELVALGTGTDSAFLARYGTTTYQEIAAAVADNRAVFVTGSANALTAVMPMTSFNTNPAMVLFGTLIGSTLQTVKLDQGVWTCSYDDIQADWSETNQLKPSYIRRKPANLVQDANYVHTDNNFTNADATKLSGIAAGAEVNVQSDWNETDTSSDAYIANKPTIPAAQVNSDWNAVSGVAEILNKPTIPSGTQLVPAATSADADKVLTVNAQGTPAWANAQAPISAGNGIDITNNVVSAKVDGTTITTNGSGELAVVNGGQSTASSFFTPAYGKSADGSLSTPRLGPSLHTRYYSFNSHGLALENSYVNSSISVLGRRPDVRLANFIQPSGNIIFMYGASTWNASWYPVWFPCNHRYNSAGYINVIDPTVYLKSKSPVTFTSQNETQYIYNSDGTYNTHFNTSNKYSFSVKAPLSTGYNVDTDTYDMIGDWTSITAPPLDEWVLTFWDGNNNTWKNLGGATEADSRLAVKWNTSSLDVKVMSGGGLDVNTGAGLYVTNPLPTSSSSDEGKVLTVNSSGSAEWGNASTVTVDQTYDGMSTNAQSGTAVAGAIATKEDAFDVGTGLEMDTSGSTPTLQVEAPVDIVAGPGIVIDNPDGNTLRVSMAADYEVTLFETTFANAVGGDVTLSENAANFDQLRITYILIGSSQGYAPLSTELVDVSTFSDGFSYFTLNQEYMESGGSNTAYFIIRTAAFGIEGNKLKFKNVVGTSDFGSKTALTSSTAKILKVVGIHRIQGGN